MATFTVRNDSENYTSSVTSITFANDPAIFHIANLSSVGGNSNETATSVVLPSPYTLLPLTSVNFNVIYDLNTLTTGTYQGTITVAVQLSTGLTEILTATNNVNLVALSGTPEYIETPYNNVFVYSTGTFTDGFEALGPISANSEGDPSGSLPGNFD